MAKRSTGVGKRRTSRSHKTAKRKMVKRARKTAKKTTKRRR